MLVNKEKEIIRYVEEFLGGEEESFDSLIRLIASDVVNIAYYYVGNTEDAKDLAQDVFIKLYNKLKGFRGQAAVSSWIYRIVTNSSIDFLRRRKKTVTLNEGVTEDTQAESDIRGKMERKDTKEFVQMAVDKLPSRQKEVIILKHFEGLKITQISKILGCSESSVKTHLFRGLENLKKIIMLLQLKIKYQIKFLVSFINR